MSEDFIKLKYPLAEAMARTFRQSAGELQRTYQVMQMIANEFEQGTLRGEGGSAFVDAIRSNLCPAIDRLTAKLSEEEADVLKAVEFMRAADAQSAQGLRS
jgi:uncharacterized protein YukE